MQIPVLNLPRPVPPERERQPQDTIPQTRAERERMKLQARAYVESHRPVPPLSFEELRRHSDATWIHTIRGIGYRMDREGSQEERRAGGGPYLVARIDSEDWARGLDF